MFKKIVLFLSFALIAQSAFLSNLVDLGSSFNSENLPNILFNNYKTYIEENNLNDKEVTRLNFLVEKLKKFLEPENEYYQIFSQENLLKLFAKKFEIEQTFLTNFDKNYKTGDCYIHWLINTNKLEVKEKYKTIKNLLLDDANPNVLDAENKTALDLVLENNLPVKFVELFCDYKVDIYSHTFDLLKNYLSDEDKSKEEEIWVDIFEKFKNQCKECEEISKDVKTVEN